MSLATGLAMGQLTCLPPDPDESQAGLWGLLRLDCLLNGPVDPAVRTSGEGVATAVQIVDVPGLAQLTRGSQGDAADTNLDVRSNRNTRDCSNEIKLPFLRHTQISSSNPN